MKDMWDVIEEAEKQELPKHADDLLISEYYEIRQLYESHDDGCRLAAIHAAFTYGYVKGLKRGKKVTREADK